MKVTSRDTDKVYHGEGPIIINFKETASFVKIKFKFFITKLIQFYFQNELDKYNRVYLNLDSEYHHIVKPKELRVRLAKKLNGGKLKFVQKL